MSNIYPYEESRWKFKKAGRLSSNSFRFMSLGASAKCSIYPEEAGALAGSLVFRGFVSPSQKRLTQGLRCKFDIFSKADEEQKFYDKETHYIYLKGDKNNALNLRVNTRSGDYSRIEMEIEALADTELSLGGDVLLTSFILSNEAASGITQADLEANLPYLVWDANKRPQTDRGEGAEIYAGTLPIMSFRDRADADAGFRTNVKLSQAGTIIERFYRDGVEELFSPVYVDLPKGRHLISDDHAYLALLKGAHFFLATLQYEGAGKMDIDTRKTLYTIETSRIGNRDIGIEGNVLDITFSGIVEKLQPHEVWVIAKDMDTDIIKAQHGEYNEDVNTVAFEYGIEYLVEVENGAIEFDGYWTKNTQKANSLKLISDQKPKVLLQRANGSLKYGDYDKPDQAELIIESAGVVDCAMVRGWNMRDIAQTDNDMGMVVAYIKSDGKAYYKTIIDGVQDINPYNLIFLGATEPLVEIRLFRTNDYRVGFTVVDSLGDSYTILTDRYYQGDSVESTYLLANFHTNSNIIQTEPTPKPVAVRNPDGGEMVEIYWNNLLDPQIQPITGISIVDSSIPPKEFLPDYRYSLTVSVPEESGYKQGDVVTVDIFTITALADEFNEYDFEPKSGLLSKTLNGALAEGGSGSGAAVSTTSTRGITISDEISSKTIFETTKERPPVSAYLNGFGIMLERYAGSGVDGFTEPVKVKITGTNGKTLFYDFANDETVQRNIPNSETVVEGLTSETLPDEKIPTPWEQEREHMISGGLSDEGMGYEPEHFVLALANLYHARAGNMVDASFGVQYDINGGLIPQINLYDGHNMVYTTVGIQYEVKRYGIDNIPL